MCSTIWALQFCYHDNLLGCRPPNTIGISGHRWRAIFIFANGASYTWSNKPINMLTWIEFVALFNVFRAENHLHINQAGGDWKRVSCHGNKMFYSHRCVFCRTISLPSFNDLHCKLAKQDSSIYVLDVILGCAYDIISHLICIFFTFFKLKYL